MGILFALMMFVFGLAVGRVIAPTKTPIPFEVVDKCEHGGKCYVETWLEVTPEEYIGLDIGDEWEVTE